MVLQRNSKEEDATTTTTNPALQIAPRTLVQNELYFHLYLHHVFDGPDANQTVGFGNSPLTDWPMYDAPLGPSAKLVARALGLHVDAGITGEDWHATFTILFEDERFKGSTLEVMGLGVNGQEWAIVGGTGEFTLAQGIIYLKAHDVKDCQQVVELDVRALYTPMKEKWVAGANTWTLGPAASTFRQV